MGVKSGTNNALTLLYQIDRENYQTLKSNNPNYSHLFNLGDVFGNKPDINREELKIKAEITQKTLEAVKKKAFKFFLKIKTKIDYHKKIELISQIITALGGSALLVTLMKIFEDNEAVNNALQLIGAIIATAGSIFSIFLNRGLGSWSFNRRNYVDDYDDLVKLNLKSESLLNNLMPKIQLFDDIEDLSSLEEIIEESEQMSQQVGTIIADYS